MNYKITLTLLTITLGIAAYPRHTQILTGERNKLRPGDALIKQQVEYKDPGPKGRDIIWDFSNLVVTNEKYRLNYIYRTKGDTLHITGYEHQTRYRYTQTNDTLWLNNFENRTTKLQLNSPEAILRFPFSYGDTLHSVFDGKGKYCEKVDVIAQGHTTVIADATGIIITPEHDTITNVLRIHSLRQYTQIGVDSALLRLDTYAWYGYGYRYPVFETVISTIQLADSSFNNFRTSFYYPPSQIVSQLTDEYNKLALENGGEVLSQVFTEAHFRPNPVVSDLQIDYKLKRTAQVWFSLHNNVGIPVATSSPVIQNEGYQYCTIKMSALMTGAYALYIHVDDMVMRQMILKK